MARHLCILKLYAQYVCAFLMLIGALSMASVSQPTDSQSALDAGPAETIVGGTPVPFNTVTGVVGFRSSASSCGGAIVWRDRWSKGKDYILTAYHCAEKVISIAPGQCVDSGDDEKIASFFVEYTQSGREKAGLSRMCRQPHEHDYGNDVLLVITKETSQAPRPSDIFPLARHFDLSPTDYGREVQVYGYSALKSSATQSQPRYAPGPLQYAKMRIGAMGYGLDPYGGSAMSLASIGEGYPVRGDSGGPLIINQELAGVASTAASLAGGRGIASYSRINPDWVRQRTGAVQITAPMPYTYLRDRYPDQALEVKGKGPAKERLRVRLVAGTAPPYKAVYPCGDDDGRVLISETGDWSCPLVVTALPEQSDKQPPLELQAMLLDSRNEYAAYDRIPLEYPAIGSVQFSRPTDNSGNYGGPPIGRVITVARYEVAGSGIRGGLPLTVARSETQIENIDFDVVCQMVLVTGRHTWTCPLDVPNAGKAYWLTAIQHDPFLNAPNPYYQAQTSYLEYNVYPPVAVQIDPPSGSEVYSWASITVQGKNTNIGANAVELSAFTLRKLDEQFPATQTVRLSKNAWLARARQFENGQPTGTSTALYQGKAADLTIDEPQDYDEHVYKVGEDIPVSGRSIPLFSVKVSELRDGKAPEGYTCKTPVGTDAGQDIWKCPSSFPSGNRGTYTIQAETLVVREGADYPVGDPVKRTFRIGEPVDTDLTDGTVEEKGTFVLDGTGEPNASLGIQGDRLTWAARLATGMGFCTGGTVPVGPDGKWRCNMLATDEGEHTVTIKEYIDGQFFNQVSRTYTVEDDDDDDDEPRIDDPAADDAMVPPGGGGGVDGGGFPITGFVPAALAAGASVTIGLLEGSVGGGFSPSANIPISPKTGVWKSPPLDFPPGGKFTIAAQVFKDGKGVGKPAQRRFFMAVGIGDQETQTLLLNDQRPITGRGQPGGKVTVSIDGKDICTLDSIPGDGHWSCGSYPSDRVHKFIVTVAQSGVPGFPTSSSAVNVEVATPPAVITGPPDNPITTPTYVISGSGVPGAYIVLGGAEQLDATVRVNSNGTWQSPTYVALPGTYTASATQYIDGQPQAQPTTLAYSVVAQTPSITSPQPNQQLMTPQVTATGTAQPLSTLRLSDAGSNYTFQDTVSVDDRGAWSSSYLVVPGSHTLTVQQFIMGNATGQASVAYSVGASIANVAITTPARGQTIGDPVYTIGGTGQPGALLTVSGQGLDTHWGIPVSGDGKWSTQYVAVSGSYTATAQQSLNGDASSWDSSATVPYTVAAAAAPAPVSISTPTEGGVVDETHSIQGQGVPGALILLAGPGDSLPCSAKVAGNGTWSCGPYALTPGPYTVQATQWIATQGGLQQAGQPLQRHYTVRQPPTPVTITVPAEGQVVTDPVYTVSGTGARGASVTVKGLGLPDRENIPVLENGSWSTTYLARPGTYTILATQYVGGSPAGDRASRTYTVDATATALSISSPEENQIVDVSPYFIQGYGQPGANVTVSDPQRRSPCQTIVSAERQWSCGPYDTGAGTYWVQAQQSVTLAGNTTVPAGDPLTRHYSVITPPPPSPGVKPPTIDRPADGATVTSLPYTVSGTAQPGMTITVNGGGPNTVLPSRTGIPVHDDGSWSTTYDEPSNADLTIAATQYLAGDPMGTSPPRSYHVRDDAIAITHPSEASTVAFPYTVDGTAKVGATVAVIGAGIFDTNIPVEPDGTWSTTVELGAADGAVTITAEQWVGGKLNGSAQRSYNVRHYPPVVIAVPPCLSDDCPDVYLQDGMQFGAGGTAGPNATIVVSQDGGPGQTVVASAQGDWQTPPIFAAPVVPHVYDPSDWHNCVIDLTNGRLKYCVRGPIKITATQYYNDVAINSGALNVYGKWDPYASSHCSPLQMNCIGDGDPPISGFPPVGGPGPADGGGIWHQTPEMPPAKEPPRAPGNKALPNGSTQGGKP